MKRNLAIDVVVLVVYVIVSLPALTGVGFHEWAGAALFVLFAVHVALHVDWAMDVAKRSRERFSWVRQGNLVLDAVILVATAAVTVSGFGISGTVLPALALFSPGYYLWGPLHATAAKVLFALLVIHMVVHWRWLAKTLGQKKGVQDER